MGDWQVVYTGDWTSTLIMTAISRIFKHVLGIDPFSWIFGEQTRINFQKEKIHDFWTPFVTRWHDDGMPLVGRHFDIASDARGDIQKDAPLWAITQTSLRDSAAFCKITTGKTNCPEGYAERFVYQYYWNVWGDGWTYEQMVIGWAATMMSLGFQSAHYHGTTKYNPLLVVRYGNRYNPATGQWTGDPLPWPATAKVPLPKSPQVPFSWRDATGLSWDINAKKWVDKTGFPDVVWWQPTNTFYYMLMPFSQEAIQVAIRCGPDGFHPDPVYRQQVCQHTLPAPRPQPLTPVEAQPIPQPTPVPRPQPQPTPVPQPQPPPPRQPNQEICQEPCIVNLGQQVLEIRGDALQNWHDQQQVIKPLAQRAHDLATHQQVLEIPALKQRDNQLGQQQQDLSRQQQQARSQQAQLDDWQNRHADAILQDLRNVARNVEQRAFTPLQDLLQRRLPAIEARLDELYREWPRWWQTIYTQIVTEIHHITDVKINTLRVEITQHFHTILHVTVQKCCQVVEERTSRGVRCLTLAWCEWARRTMGTLLECYFEANTAPAQRVGQAFAGWQTIEPLVDKTQQVRRQQRTGEYAESVDLALHYYTSLRKHEWPTATIRPYVPVPRFDFLFESPDDPNRSQAVTKILIPELKAQEADPCR